MSKFSISLSLLVSWQSVFNPLQAQYSLWGVTAQGGKYGAGVVFNTDSNGSNQVVIHDFYKAQGKTPGDCQMCLGPDGQLYGTTQEGSKQDGGGGVFFSFNPTDGSYKKLLEFDSSNFGTKPKGKLTLAKNGKIYGMTSWAGDGGVGNIYEYDPTLHLFTKKAKFDPTLFYNCEGGMIEVEEGIFYGMTFRGGLVDKGVVFTYNSSTAVLSSKLNIGISMGYLSNGGFIKSANGKLYALTSEGGGGTGTLLEYDYKANTCKAKYNFQSDYGLGEYGQGTLVEGATGVFYGVANKGGSENSGILFQYDVNTNVFTKKVDFIWTTKGANPVSGLILASNGKAYGVTSQGGVGGLGALYEYDLTTSTFTKKADVGDSIGTGSYGISGNFATAPLIQAKNGKLYGITSEGGTCDGGVLFEYDLTLGIYTKKIDFNCTLDGGNPMGRLLLASDGKLYGTADGGKFNFGMIYSVDPITKQFKKEFDFHQESNGFSPTSFLIEGEKGGIIGTVSGGGASGQGGLYEYKPASKSYQIVKNFDPVTGTNPVGKPLLIQGKLYGVLANGGVNGQGTLYSYELATSTWNTLFTFTDTIVGNYPATSLVQLGNKLYGTCLIGGTNNNDGTLFEYDLGTSQIKKKANFNSPFTGRGPTDQLIKTSRNTLLGVTTAGGLQDVGTIFEFDPAKSLLQSKLDFSTQTDPRVSAAPIETSLGRYFGLLSSNSSYSGGILYEYDLDGKSLKQTISFDGVNGSQPFASSLTKVPLPFVTSFELSVNSSSKRSVFPNPCTSSLHFNGITQEELMEIYLSDLRGQKKGSYQFFNETTFQIDTSFLPIGMYVAEVTSSKGSSRHAFVKQ